MDGRVFLRLVPRQIQMVFRVDVLHVEEWRRVDDQRVRRGRLPRRHQSHLAAVLWPSHSVGLHAIGKQHALA